ncbi:MAG: B12-binding domain-containing radical SAM protein [Acutalibacteraceae bacterium]
MKNVYMVQANNSLSKSLFLPYASGCLVANAWQSEVVRSNYEFKGFIYRKDSVDAISENMESPFFVGFSSYMWNVEFNLSLAERIKKKYPDCIIAFGGPQIPDDTTYLEEYHFIDILMHGEGERTFSEVLETFACGGDLSLIHNISLRAGDKTVQTEKKVYNDISQFPSPYALGLFDYIVNDSENDGIQFDTILETNRGCPYGCIYCCWAGSGEHFRLFPMERVKSDLLWMAKHKIAYCVCADSNFGILDRDEEIAGYVIGLKKKYGYPQKFETTAAKNKDDFVFRINKKLEKAGLNRGISVAVQSMSPEALRIAGRENMSVNDLAFQLRRYRENDMFTYTDIILGLPGETYESFCKGLFDVIEAGQHTSININRLEFLPNTKMYSSEFIEKYKIKTITSHLCQNHSTVTEDDSFSSRSEIVVETSTMTKEEWKNAIKLSTCVLSFHCMGLLRFIAIYLRKSHDISYYDFYMELYKYIRHNNSFIGRIVDGVCRTVDDFLENKSDLYFFDKQFGDIYWSFEEGLFLSVCTQIDSFYKEIREFLNEKNYFDEELSDLLKYQKEIIALPSSNKKMIKAEYDWCSYFRDIFAEGKEHPEKSKSVILIEGSDTESWVDYAKEYVWFGKRSEKMISFAKRIS